MCSIFCCISMQVFLRLHLRTFFADLIQKLSQFLNCNTCVYDLTITHHVHHVRHVRPSWCEGLPQQAHLGVGACVIQKLFFFKHWLHFSHRSYCPLRRWSTTCPWKFDIYLRVLTFLIIWNEIFFDIFLYLNVIDKNMLSFADYLLF